MLDFERYRDAVEGSPRGRAAGRITRVVGLTVECRGIQVPLGELCAIQATGGGAMTAEVVGFRDGATLLMPLDDAVGLQPGSTVVPLGKRLTVNCGEFLLGQVVDALGRPFGDSAPLPAGIEQEVFRKAPTPLERVQIDTPMATGVSTLDSMLTLGMGQRIGIFAGSGVGKSTLLSTIAREATADVNVIALIGERGREVTEFITHALGTKGLARSVVVVATSDAPPLLRFKGAFTAMAIAEYFRDRGANVMVMMDSITRLANASREIGLSLGEPPTVKGYPPSFFSTMPRLVERMGRTRAGSITGLLTVLVDADDMNEPVADTMRGLLDGHVILSRRIASRGQYPAIDVLQSVSRVMDAVVQKEHVAAARAVRESMAVYEDARDLISVGAYRTGSDPKIDLALGAQPAIEKLIKQPSGVGRSFDETKKLLAAAAAAGASGARVDARTPPRRP
jgi:flagellum-specific ATP synthase